MNSKRCIMYIHTYMYRVREKFCNPLVLWTTIIKNLVVQSPKVLVQKRNGHKIMKFRGIFTVILSIKKLVVMIMR